MNASQEDAAGARELSAAAARAMAAGDFAAARETLKKVLLLAGGNAAVWLNLAAACRALSDTAGAVAAVEGALKADPRSFRALLMKGSLLERAGEIRRAARAYGPALALAPPQDSLDPATANALAHARAVHARHLEELAAFVQGRIGTRHASGASAESRRIAAFVDLALGRRTNFRQEPTEFFYPGLPAIEFHERDRFAWLPELEAATAAIRAELVQILRDDFRDFVPYVTYPDTVPLDQWAELNHSRRWGALHLYLYGARVEENCRRCPQTMRAVDALPQPQVPGRSPAAMFSALQPKTRIPPHTGVANTRLVVHLPLIVPDGCAFRVGNQTRPWREGEAWVFDDTIEHEAWNDSDRPRVILICDVWHPDLSRTERDAIAGVMTAMDRFNDFAPKDSI